MKKILVLTSIITMLGLTGCSSLNNWWNKTSAGITSSDYVVVKYAMDGKPSRYWIIRNNFVNNEEHSDGYYWTDSHNGINRATNADAFDIKGLSDDQVVKKYGLENAVKLVD